MVRLTLAVSDMKPCSVLTVAATGYLKLKANVRRVTVVLLHTMVSTRCVLVQHVSDYFLAVDDFKRAFQSRDDPWG